jgi:hypothetical protein
MLVAGAVLNYAYPLVAQALAIPFGIEFVIVAYCLVVMAIPLTVPEVFVIGIVSGALNIISNPAHVATILGGQAPTAAEILALSNFVSEPVGIMVCFFAFAYLAGRARGGAPFAAAFIATMASGLVYLLAVLLLNPGLIGEQPAYPATFLVRVGIAALTNAVVVQVVFMAAGRPVKDFLADSTG